MIACSICGTAAASRTIKVRSGKEMTLWHCTPCEFDFFVHDPSANLAANKLDESRLKAAGLDIPALEKDFANGTSQSLGYLDEYIEAGDRGRCILEIGCSIGYFLALVEKAGAKPYGVELNTVRATYVNEHLGIPCDTTLDACEQRGVKFCKIFMFYVLEYVPDPVAYLQRLVAMLEPGGALILVTPNLDDTLKDLWGNEAFGKFFYDEHAINYMSARTVDRMMARLEGVKPQITTRQGYSFVNHTSWHLTNAPRTTGIVGGDNFVSGIRSQLVPGAPVPRLGGRRKDLAATLAGLIARFDSDYKKAIEVERYGNQIRIVARK